MKNTGPFMKLLGNSIFLKFNFDPRNKLEDSEVGCELFPLGQKITKSTSFEICLQFQQVMHSSIYSQGGMFIAAGSPPLPFSFSVWRIGFCLKKQSSFLSGTAETCGFPDWHHNSSNPRTCHHGHLCDVWDKLFSSTSWLW